MGKNFKKRVDKLSVLWYTKGGSLWLNGRSPTAFCGQYFGVQSIEFGNILDSGTFEFSILWIPKHPV